MNCNEKANKSFISSNKLYEYFMEVIYEWAIFTAFHKVKNRGIAVNT